MWPRRAQPGLSRVCRAKVSALKRALSVSGSTVRAPGPDLDAGGSTSRAIDIINTLAGAHAGGGLKRALATYVKPEVLCIDELGYLPIDKFGADCLFQIISHRYERGATLLTTNRPYKQWASIFNGDATLTSALLDRLLDHVETVVIEGKSYRGQTHAEV